MNKIRTSAAFILLEAQFTGDGHEYCIFWFRCNADGGAEGGI